MRSIRYWPGLSRTYQQFDAVELLAKVEEPHVFVVVDHRNGLLGPNNA
jgi:hypothetical protein